VEPEALQAEVLPFTDVGVRTVKIEIGGGPLDVDMARVEAVLHDGASLAADANGRSDGPEVVRHVKALSALRLDGYAKPTDTFDFEGLKIVSGSYHRVLATGEDFLARGEANNLILDGGLRSAQDALQMDSAVSYGFTENQEILADPTRHGWALERCVPHGGHQFNLVTAAGRGLGGSESYPRLFEPFGCFADAYKVGSVYVDLLSVPGIGLGVLPPVAPVLAQLQYLSQLWFCDEG